MTDKNALYRYILKWCVDVGHTPMVDDMNDLIDMIQNWDKKI